MRNFYLFTTLVISLFLTACSASSVKTEASSLGQTSSMESLLTVVSQPGPIFFEKHLAANWSVPLSGLLNLEHPKAISAGLTDRDEPIQIFVYTIQHPKYGTFLIDSGVSESFVDAINNPDVSFIVKKAMNIAGVDTRLTTKDLIQKHSNIKGVLLTHIHVDHIMGLTDIASNIPVYSGPGDAQSTALINAATHGSTNRLLANVTSLQEWQFDEQGIVDVFGDGSLWAISSPGHTPGTTAYLVRSNNGPQLIVGDVTHTRWGWDNGVGPGTYSKDIPTGSASLKKLIALVEKEPKITVHPGHQN